MDDRLEPARGAAAVTEALLASGAFVETVFHCPQCGLGGTSVARAGTVGDHGCLGCGAQTVVTVLDRFPRR
jgi:hypothetical protein